MILNLLEDVAKKSQNILLDFCTVKGNFPYIPPILLNSIYICVHIDIAITAYNVIKHTNKKQSKNKKTNESKYYRILTYDIIGRLTAAATLASTLQLSSKPKKATAVCFHCCNSNLVPTIVSPVVSPHIKLIW